MSADALLQRCDGVEGRGPRWRAICPAHKSKHKTRSLAIYEVGDGRVLVKCHAGCSFEEIVAAAGMEISDFMPPKAQADHVPRIKRPWTVRDLVSAAQVELFVATLVLQDVAAGRPISRVDRGRADTAAKRLAALAHELSA